MVTAVERERNKGALSRMRLGPPPVWFWQHGCRSKLRLPKTNTNRCKASLLASAMSAFNENYHRFWSTLWAPLSGTFLRTLPDLVTPLKGHSSSPCSCPVTQSERFGYWYDCRSNLAPKHARKHETQGKKKKSSILIQTIVVLFVLV